jgi:hypothetical protein
MQLSHYPKPVKFNSPAYWSRMFVDQTRWMAERGCSLDGYLKFYGRFNRTVDNITDIYNADRAEWEKLRTRVRELRTRR